MKYVMSWTQKDGTRIENQIYTAENITSQLLTLESWGATDITFKSIEEEQGWTRNDYDVHECWDEETKTFDWDTYQYLCDCAEHWGCEE